jgi:hypothetical protein
MKIIFRVINPLTITLHELHIWGKWVENSITVCSSLFHKEKYYRQDTEQYRVGNIIFNM